MRWVLAIALVLATSARAVPVTTEGASFEVPEGWKCEVPGTGGWKCQGASKELLMLVTLLARRDATLEAFEAHLKQPKKPEAKVVFARKRDIAGHLWIDGLQQNSELPGFFTRYVATTVEAPRASLAVLVSLSYAEAGAQAHAPVVERIVRSLRPVLR